MTKQKSTLNVAAIEAAEDLEIVEVAVPEWAPKDSDPKEALVYVRALTARERDEFERENINLRKVHANDDPAAAVSANIRARLVSKCLCRGADDRTPLFSDFQKGIKVIARKSGIVVDRLFDVASRLNGMTEADVEEIAGNSEATAPNA